MIPVVIPAKPLDRALSRLAGVVGPEARTAIQAAMLADVVRAATGFSDQVIVVSADTRVAKIAADAGAQVVPDAVPAAGIDVAVRRGLDVVGRDEVIVLMGDLPLATSDGLHAVAVSLGRGPGIACAISADGTGTNALYLRPPRVIATAFGVDSLGRHLAAARAAGVGAVSVVAPGLERDIDTPDDLAALIRSGAECDTVRVCRALGVPELLAPMAAGQ